MSGGEQKRPTDVCRCGHPRSAHAAEVSAGRAQLVRWGECSICACGEFDTGPPTLRLDPNDPAVAEAERRARLPQEPAGLRWLLLVEMLEHQREVQALALAEQEAKTRKAKVELATAERIHQLVVDHDKLVDLPDIGGKPS